VLTVYGIKAQGDTDYRDEKQGVKVNKSKQGSEGEIRDLSCEKPEEDEPLAAGTPHSFKGGKDSYCANKKYQKK
jgi:hypothetical protein